LEGADFEGNGVAEETKVLKNGGKKWFPHGVSVLEKKKHGAMGPVDASRKHGEEASERGVDMMRRANAERDASGPSIARRGIQGRRGKVKEGISVGRCTGGLNEIGIRVDDPFLEKEEETLFVEGFLNEEVVVRFVRGRRCWRGWSCSEINGLSGGSRTGVGRRGFIGSRIDCGSNSGKGVAGLFGFLGLFFSLEE
jgi:hypothetical protein